MKNNILINKRIKHLKDIKKLANQFLEENKRLKLNPTKGWENKTIENNISQLKEIIKKINRACGKNSIHEHVQFDLKLIDYHEKQTNFEINDEMMKIWLERINENISHYKIFTYSVSYSIVHDLYWIEDATIQDLISIANGNKSPETLGQFLDKKLEFIEREVLPYLINDEKYSTTVEVFETAAYESKKESYIASNILLIVGIESLVRLLGNFVYSKQNPSLSEEEVYKYVFEKFQSLEGLISKGNWEDDLSVKLIDAVLMSEYIFDESLQKAVEKKRKHLEAQQIIEKRLGELSEYLRTDTIGMSEKALNALNEVEEIKIIAENNMINLGKENISVSFRTRLQFLIRRYKEDRNQLIHGNFPSFDFKWKNYIYFSALQKVFRLISEYNDKYNIKL